ncbi:Integrator complex subunit 11, partial [Perkinsus olseni]
MRITIDNNIEDPSEGSAVCLERERDFNFGKLRQVEILLQEIDVSQKSTEGLREMVQTILFASEEEEGEYVEGELAIELVVRHCGDDENNNLYSSPNNMGHCAPSSFTSLHDGPHSSLLELDKEPAGPVAPLDDHSRVLAIRRDPYLRFALAAKVIFHARVRAAAVGGALAPLGVNVRKRIFPPLPCLTNYTKPAQCRVVQIRRRSKRSPTALVSTRTYLQAAPEDGVDEHYDD